MFKKFFTPGYYRFKVNIFLSYFGYQIKFISNINRNILTKIKKVNMKSSEIPKKWSDIDSTTQSKFLMNNQIGLIENYKSDDINGTEIIYSKKLINRLIRLAQEKVEFYYGETDKFLFECLDKYNLQNKEVAILGSTIPWYESVILSKGGKPVTIEYNNIETDDERLKLYTNEEFSKINKKFDFALSISSFEHDGLGRYGDPIDPEGDFKAMKNVKDNILKKGGKLFLSIPIGFDKLVWNLHRIYGEKRFPILIEEFKLIDSAGFSDELFKRSDIHGKLSGKQDSEKPFQPIFVLEV